MGNLRGRIQLPAAQHFLTILEFFLFVLWIWLLIIVFMDIFRSHDLGGFAKALWVIFVLIIPLIGILVYLIVRGGKMRERAEAEARQDQEAMDQYVRQVSGGSTADQLAKLAELKDSGALSQAEFDAQKAKLLNS